MCMQGSSNLYCVGVWRSLEIDVAFLSLSRILSVLPDKLLDSGY